MTKILNTSFNDPHVKEYIDKTLGKGYSFLQRLRMKGIGSPRMLVGEVAVELEHCLNPEHYPTYSSIELRPRGILVHFNRNTITHAWVIPFYTLSIFHAGSITIHSQGKFVRYKETGAADLKFIRKVMDEKIHWRANSATQFPPSE